MAKIKVLAVIDHLGGGGAERQFLELIKRLDRDRFDITVFLTEGGGQRLSEAVESNIDVRYISKEIKRNTFKALLGLIAIIRKSRPDVIMAWLSYSIALTAFAASALGRKRLIFSERSSLERLFDVEVRFGALKKYILKLAFKRASFVVTNSNEVAGEFSSLGYCGKEKIKVIYNGLDLKGFSVMQSKASLRRKLGLADDKLYGIYAGKLEYRKGITFLMEAIERLDMPELGFLVAGDGSLAEKVRSHSKVSYLGYRNNVVEYIGAADFLVLPSLYEGLPNVVLEAMAAGTPVIASKVSGVPEIIEDRKTGLLVPPEDANAIKGAVAELLKDADLRQRIVKNASEKIKEFEMGAMVSSYESLFSGLMAFKNE